VLKYCAKFGLPAEPGDSGASVSNVIAKVHGCPVRTVMGEELTTPCNCVGTELHTREPQGGKKDPARRRLRRLARGSVPRLLKGFYFFRRSWTNVGRGFGPGG
jgi:hypothetical protein